MYIALKMLGKKKLYTQIIDCNVYTVIINIEQIMAEGVELGAFFIYSSSSHKIVNRRVFWCNIKRI
ncbi:hypothetical protein K250101E9_12590 [Enterocloster aldenensis]